MINAEEYLKGKVNIDELTLMIGILKIQML